MLLVHFPIDFQCSGAFVGYSQKFSVAPFNLAHLICRL